LQAEGFCLLQAILAAISAVADTLGEFVKESEATSQNVMQLVLGVWQFPSGTFPANIEDSLYDHVVAALLPLGFSFMSSMTPERAEVCRTLLMIFL
jgi:hypothetical protein